MKKTVLLSSILAFVLFIRLPPPAHAETFVSKVAQEDDPVIAQDVTYVFGEELEFIITLAGEENPETTWLFIQPKGMGIANFTIDIQETGENHFLVSPSEILLKPFSKVTYWYQLEYPDGSEVVTEEDVFFYVDNRVEWQHISNEQFDLYWQEGNHDFGLAALNIAETAWSDLRSDFLNAPESPLIVYIYPSSSELQRALQLGQMQWVAGHADPQLNAILISIAPGPEQRLEMQRQIPHELAHIFTYASLADGYINQPRWLLEGLASMAEATENQEYTQALMDAAQGNSLIPIESLCDAFPSEIRSVILAYAQSLSFTEYLQTEYGQNQLKELMSAYGEGITCEAGFRRIYGVSIAQAQADWQQAVFGTQRVMLIWQAFRPYLLLLVVLGVIPFTVTILRRKYSKPESHE
jgi:hypothetical protein